MPDEFEKWLIAQLAEHKDGGGMSMAEAIHGHGTFQRVLEKYQATKNAGSMKVSDIAKCGFYWYAKDGEWSIVNADDWLGPNEWKFTYTGSEVCREPSEMPGEFIGPLIPPK